jgi:hypothetical protein
MYNSLYKKPYVGLQELTKRTKTKLPGHSPQANYTDQATAALLAKLVPTFAGRGCCVVSAANSHGR